MLKLIVALDFDNTVQAMKLVNQLPPDDCALKIGLELFTHAGPEFVQSLVKQNYKIFLDLKFHDIPNTVAQACKAAAKLGVWMINVHASGGLAMMQAAKEALVEFASKRPFLIAVTVLTSMGNEELSTLGVSQSLPEQVIHLAKLAQTAGLDGVVCSALETSIIKETCGQDFLTITPGIRFADGTNDDQTRVITPEKALQAGSDFLVMGRPITKSSNPRQVVQQIVQIMQNVP